MGRCYGAGTLCHSNYLEDLPATADDSTGHTLKVTEAVNTFTDHDSRLYAHLDLRPSPIILHASRIYRLFGYLVNIYIL